MTKKWLSRSVPLGSFHRRDTDAGVARSIVGAAADTRIASRLPHCASRLIAGHELLSSSVNDAIR